MMDFNDTPSQQVQPRESDRDEVRNALLLRLESVLLTLFPAGKKRHSKFHIGDVLGSPGDSLEVVLTSDKAGLWTDRAIGDGGDIFDLVARHHGCDAHSDFATVLDHARDLVGRAPVQTTRKAKREAPVDDLGPATAKWDYLDRDGKLIAVVYRYDPPGRRKEFRPWDAKRRRMAPPDPRPLYNQPGMAASDVVVLTEGEKCAQALITHGVCATTAMHGAKAPVDKTDWSPLAGKRVLIWPDKDKPGWEYAQDAGQAALDAGASSCAILLPPEDRPEGWDAADAIADGFDVPTFLTSGPRMEMHLPDDAPDVETDAQSEQTVWGTDDAMALAFTRRYHHDWRYVAAWGKWLMWDGQRWRGEQTLAATDLIRHVCRHAALHTENPRIASKLAAASTVSSAERLARTDRRHAGTTEEWDANLWLINTSAGTVDLQSGRMRPHRREDFMLKMTAGTLNSHSKCPTWLRFINEVTGGDIQLASYLQRMFGYCLTGLTREHAMFFLYGTGANGKSVFVNTMLAIMGDYGMNAPMETFMASRNDRHPTELAMLRGARLVVASETEQGRGLNESRMKELTGGDLITARDLFQPFFTYKPQFKVILTGNHKPSLKNIDEAIRRRLHLVPFTVTIPAERRDKELQNKLMQERDGIFEWALTGCLEWQRNGLQPPECVLKATDEYFEAEDAIGRWIEERCILTPQAKSLTSELFADWKRWAETVSEDAGTQRRFSDLLLSRNVQKWRNGVGLRGFQGIGLRHPAEYHDPRFPEND